MTPKALSPAVRVIALGGASIPAMTLHLKLGYSLQGTYHAQAWRWLRVETEKATEVAKHNTTVHTSHAASEDRRSEPETI